MFGKKKSNFIGTTESNEEVSRKDKTQSSDQTASSPADAQEDAAVAPQASDEVGTLPMGTDSSHASPPLKPFKKESLMSNSPSSSYRPEIPRKVVDIPNPAHPSMERSDAPGDEDGKRLVVGKAISLNGDISACETLVVHGIVEAKVTDAETLEVAEGGLFKGEAEVDHAFISGTFEGTLKARMTLEVAESGHVKGTINYNNISIASGGRVQGTIDVIDAK